MNNSISTYLVVILAITSVLFCILSPTASIDAQACSTNLTPGATVQCTLSTVDEVDQFTFTAQAGDVLIIRASRTSGLLHLRLRLRDSQGTLIREVAGTGVIAEMVGVTLTADDTYTLFVDERNGSATGAYAVSMQQLDAPAQPVTLPFGAAQSATMAVAGQMAAYTISGEANDRLFIRMSSGTSNFNPQLRLYDPDGTLICAATSYGNTATNAADCSLPTTGTYMLLVNEWNEGKTGSFYVFVQRLNYPVAATPLSYGAAAIGSLVTPGTVGTYTVAGDAGDILTIRMGRGSGNVQPSVQLFAPDGTHVCGSFSYGSITEENECVLPQSGTFTVLASDLQEGRTGTYGVFAQRLNAPGQGSNLPLGTPTTGQVTIPGELRTYRFSAESGEVLLARVAGSVGLSPVMTIYGPDGVDVCNGFSYSQVAEVSSCTLPANGTYTMLLGDFDAARSGSYTLHLQSLTNPANAQVLPFGLPTSRSLDTAGALDTYTFSGDAGAKLRIRAIGSQGVNPSLRLYAPSGLSVCSDTTYGSIAETGECLLPSTGSYTLIVNDFNGADTGTYSLNLTCLVDTCGPGPSYDPFFLPIVEH
jgi:hypothetical protein